MWTLFGMTPKMRKNPSCAKLKRKLQENKTPLYPPHKQKRKNPSLIKYFNFFFLSLNLENLAFFSQRRDSLLQFPKASRTIWQNDPPCIFPPSQQFGKETATKTTTTTTPIFWYQSIQLKNPLIQIFVPHHSLPDTKRSWQSFETFLKNKQKSELLRYFDFEL